MSFLEILQELDSKVKLEQVLSLMGKQPEKDNGVNLIYSCPFHSDSTPSFNVNVSMNKFYCFSCLAKGGVYNLVKSWLSFHDQITKPSFGQIIKFLKDSHPEVSGLSKKAVINAPYDKNKRKRFEEAYKATPASPILKPVTPEQKALYITGIMKGLEPDILSRYVTLGARSDKNSESSFQEDFLGQLLGEM